LGELAYRGEHAQRFKDFLDPGADASRPRPNGECRRFLNDSAGYSTPKEIDRAAQADRPRSHNQDVRHHFRLIAPFAPCGISTRIMISAYRHRYLKWSGS